VNVVNYLKLGGKRKLTIPPELGYGAEDVPGIVAANATIICGIDLIAVQQLQFPFDVFAYIDYPSS
jgi:FKBP-type peptidyl-prolyl cis-trans isomerase